MVPQRRSWLAFAWLSLCAACSGSRAPEPVVDADGGEPSAPRDAGTRDEGEPQDPADDAAPPVVHDAGTLASGSLHIMTYNVAGLPAALSSSQPAENTKLIGPLLEPYDLVHVQEDFNYHADLYAGDVHPHRSATSGGVPIGDGLNTLSYSEFSEFQRTKWNDCNGTDCLTPKGFTFARHRLAEGVYVDVYNVHTNASTEEPDLAARRSNVSQLAAFIDENSRGNAVMLFGDTNTRYTRAGDNIRELGARGLRDVWIELVREGDVPVQGAEALTNCEPSHNQLDCEIVDKVFVRDSRMLAFVPRSYRVEDTAFVRPDGEQLSDHYPVIVDLDYMLAEDLRASDLVGGAGGTGFNDAADFADQPVVASVALRGAERLDGLLVRYDDGRMVTHGGTGGDENALPLAPGDTLQVAELCTVGSEDAATLSFASLESARGEKVEAGARSGDCVRHVAPPSFAIVGFFGRAGEEIDRLGVLYARVR